LPQFGRYGGETGGTFKATLQRVLESDDGSVVGVHHNSAERDGKHLDTGCCITFELKDGRITDGREHFFNLYNWDEFWS
jgi:ketosteroid isomerase-like protein